MDEREKTPLKLHLLLVNCLRQVSNLSSPGPQHFTEAFSALRKFYADQNKISWENLFCGFVSKSLATYIEAHLPDDANESGNTWVVGLLRLLQKWVTSVWIQRCKLEHNKQKQEQYDTSQNLIQRIEQLYTM